MLQNACKSCRAELQIGIYTWSAALFVANPQGETRLEERMETTQVEKNNG